MSDTLEEKLDVLFNARYAKQLAELNKNVYISAKNSNGGFDVPVVVVGEGGGTVIAGPTKQDLSQKLNPPAEVKLEQKDMLPYVAVYRIAIPLDECEIAAKNPAYFNYLFDKVMVKAIGNYRATFGNENVVRFGSMFITAARPGGGVFVNLADTHMELRLRGEWASDHENYT